MTPELQALIERAHSDEPAEVGALLRLVEAFEPPTERQRQAFLSSFVEHLSARPVDFA